MVTTSSNLHAAHGTIQHPHGTADKCITWGQPTIKKELQLNNSSDVEHFV